MTGQKPWSTTIRHRRLKWYGHLLRLSPQCPARQALNEARKIVRRPIGRPITTWLQTIDKDLIVMGITKGYGQKEAQHRPQWNYMITRAMSAHADAFKRL